MKFIHLSDVHLSDDLDFSGTYSSLIRENIWISLKKILNENMDVDFLLIAGDLYERNFFTLKQYKRLFSIFENFKKDIYYVGGNHDYINKDNEFFLNYKPSNIHIFPSDEISYFERENIRIYGISYDDRIFNKKFSYNINLDKNFYNILLIHANIGDNSNYLNIDIEKLEKIGFSYVGLGHIHKFQKIRDNIFYPSSIEPRDFSESGNHGYIKVEDKKIKFINSSLMDFKDLSLYGEDFDNYNKLIHYLLDEKEKKYNFLDLNLINFDKNIFDQEKIKKDTAYTYIKFNWLKENENKELGEIFPNSLLSKYIREFDNKDMKDSIVKKAFDLGIDAILRSKDG